MFVEEGVVDHLNTLIPILNAIFIEDEEQAACKEKVKSILRLIGRFSPATAFEPICLSIINMQITDSEETSINALTTYRCLLEGHLEALPDNQGLLNKRAVVEKVFAELGREAFLATLTKYMLNPFSELFVSLFTWLKRKALPRELEQLQADYRAEITRISLTALSIPVFLLITDNAPEMNYKLVKSTIEKSARLLEDEDAKCYFETLEGLVAKDEFSLIDVARPENPTAVNRNSNETLACCALLNYYLIKRDPGKFGHVLYLFEHIAADKETFSKVIINLTSYLHFYVLSAHPDQRSRPREGPQKVPRAAHQVDGRPAVFRRQGHFLEPARSPRARPARRPRAPERKASVGAQRVPGGRRSGFEHEKAAARHAAGPAPAPGG